MTYRSRVGLSLVLGAAFMVAFAGAALATHPRPGGGSPMRAPLVPSFEQCLAPNSMHIAPLAFPSCTSASLESSMLTTNTTGAMNAFARLTVYCTDAQLPPCTPNDGNDTEDIKVVSSGTDIRCAVGGVPGCRAPGADYTGMLLGRSNIRITDHSNGLPPTVCLNALGNPPCVAATMQDLAFSVPANCVDNGGPNGANCAINTTIDTLVPTTVKELQRATVSVFGLTVLDQGPDGSISVGGSATCPPTCGSGDETTAAVQGLFMP